MTAVPFSPSVLHICPHSTDRTEKVATLPGTLYTKMTFPFGLPFFIWEAYKKKSLVSDFLCGSVGWVCRVGMFRER